MRTSTLKDVAEGAAQAGVDWVGGGDVGLDFDGAVTAGGADELPGDGQLRDEVDLAAGTLMFHLLSRHAAFGAA
ncbi:MAG TPA: hypothetical protein VE979_09560 [Streptosporangiaceae bacterium]|jgi:hypothetical protein|nr:hypothetical protein [Streptosporangiaceae bacterium]